MQKVLSFSSSEYVQIHQELEGLVKAGHEIVNFSVAYDSKEEEYALFVVYK